MAPPKVAKSDDNQGSPEHTIDVESSLQAKVCCKSEASKKPRKPGLRLFRTLGAQSPNVMAAARFWGLHRDIVSAAAAGVAVFPFDRITYKPNDAKMLFLTSAALRDLRVPRGFWPITSGMPFFSGHRRARGPATL